MKKYRNKGITLIVLVITIIILLILAGVTIASLGGENGLIAKVQKAKKVQVEAEMKEQLILALQELQITKEGNATLDDVTQEWADDALNDYDPTITSDASISGKKVMMSKNGIISKYMIDEKLNVTEIEQSDSSIELTYEVKSREGENLLVSVLVTDKENGLEKIEYNDGHIQDANGKKEASRDCTLQLGVEYKVKITSKNGEEKTETILINDYYYTITKNLGEGINIDNISVKTAYNKPYIATLTTENNYILNAIIIKMNGIDITNTAYDETTGTINIEKVTGDIEITATSNKLEIIVSDAYVNTSQNATSSATSNSIDKSTNPSLYVSFTATLEGQNCTIEPPLTQAITKNGTYTYTITGTYKGKTINTTKEVKVDQFKSATNLVKYDAGDWAYEDIYGTNGLNSLKLYDLNLSYENKTSFKLDDDDGLNFTFGGFTYKGDPENSKIQGVTTSRNESCKNSYGIANYDGWQLLESETKTDSEGNTIKNADGTDRIYVRKIIHAGSPENFVYIYSAGDDAFRAEYLLSSGAKMQDCTTLSSGTKINVRNWDMYKDKNQLALIDNVHIMTVTEAQSISTELLNIGCPYWLENAADAGGMWFVGGDGGLNHRQITPIGIRPVVEMNEGVYIASGDGTESKPFVLEKEQ